MEKRKQGKRGDACVKKKNIKYYLDKDLNFYYIDEEGQILPVKSIEKDAEIIKDLIEKGASSFEREEVEIPKKFSYGITEDGEMLLFQKNRTVSVDDLKRETQRLKENAEQIQKLAEELHATQEYLDEIFMAKNPTGGGCAFHIK